MKKGVLLQLYWILLRPHLQYCVQLLSPHLRKDRLGLEAVQRMITRLPRGMRRLFCDERLSELG